MVPEYGSTRSPLDDAPLASDPLPTPTTRLPANGEAARPGMGAYSDDVPRGGR